MENKNRLLDCLRRINEKASMDDILGDLKGIDLTKIEYQKNELRFKKIKKMLLIETESFEKKVEDLLKNEDMCMWADGMYKKYDKAFNTMIFIGVSG